MSERATALAQRRAELIELCELQRTFLAEEVDALRGPLEGGLTGMLGVQKPLLLAAAGVALGLLVTRPKRLLSALAGGLSVWKVASKVLPMLARLRSQS
ncbi:hypothetical protein GCM10027321_07880 [Massilia terrae]|uniref:YqjK-like protein n=1 Tax=Massilia terrae TaxID=1811224 RepID=A0ABT2D086_9BURK|nr:hypothetical protein [Massilia terrae]MCS0659639.1 hypothetical protein [Massilia terrae]